MKMKKTDLAVRRLEEKLETRFSGKPLSVMQKELRKKMGKAVKSTRLHEILLYFTCNLSIYVKNCIRILPLPQFPIVGGVCCK